MICQSQEHREEQAAQEEKAVVAAEVVEPAVVFSVRGAKVAQEGAVVQSPDLRLLLHPVTHFCARTA